MNCLCMHKMNKVWLLYYYVDCNYLKVAIEALKKCTALLEVVLLDFTMYNSNIK